MSARLCGLIPVAAIQGAGSPITPAASCASAVERAGLRQPSQPSASATSVTGRCSHDGSATSGCGRQPSHCADRQRRCRQAQCDLRVRELPASPSRARRPQARTPRSPRHRRRSRPGRGCPRPMIGVTSGTPGEPAQHGGAAVGRGRQHQRRPQDHPVEIERRRDARRPPPWCARTRSAPPARRRSPRRAPRGGCRPARRHRTARRSPSHGRARVSSRAPSCSTPTQFTTASMSLEQRPPAAAVREPRDIGLDPARIGKRAPRGFDRAPDAHQRMAVAMEPRQAGRADQAVGAGHEDAH